MFISINYAHCIQIYYHCVLSHLATVQYSMYMFEAMNRECFCVRFFANFRATARVGSIHLSKVCAHSFPSTPLTFYSIERCGAKIRTIGENFEKYHTLIRMWYYFVDLSFSHSSIEIIDIKVWKFVKWFSNFFFFLHNFLSNEITHSRTHSSVDV